MKSLLSRQSLLRQAFCDLPQKIGDYPLRPLSAASFELLAETGNRLVSDSANVENGSLNGLLTAVSEYIWIHYAPLDEVIAVDTRENIPRTEIKKIGFSLEIGEALNFTTVFLASALRMAAAMSEIDEEGASPGKPETPPIGSPPSSSPVDAPETPAGNVISFGSPPSSEPSPISTPPVSMLEEDVDGSIPLMTLPTLPQTPPESPSEPFGIDTATS